MTRKTKRGPRVLVVDDVAEIRQAVRWFLESRHGCAVHEAEDGLAAVHELMSGGYDLLVTDLLMPLMNGLELTGFVRSTPALARLPILMLTTRGDDADRRRAELIGVDAYVVKPFAPESFEQAVAPLLKARPRPRKRAAAPA